jgi:superfamily II DNA or RNA helicase
MQVLMKTQYDLETIEAVKKALTFKEPKFRGKESTKPPYFAYAESESILQIPKFYPMSNRYRNNISHISFLPQLTLGHPARFSFDNSMVMLRDLQKEAIEKIVMRLSKATILQPRGAVLQLPCGYGKTRCASFIMQRLGVVTLVLVSNKQLAVQFERALHEISVDVTTATLPKPSKPLPDVSVIFGTLQSIYSRRYSAEYLAPIGLVVIDEAHHIAAPTFAQAMCTLPVARVLALTATPERSDGKENLIYYLAGDTAYKALRPKNEKLSIHVESIREYSRIFNKQYESLCERMQLVVRLSQIESRNNLIVNALVFFSKQDRNILVLAKLVAHLHELARIFSEKKHETDTFGFFTGEEPQPVRDASAKCKVIFATFDMAKEGLDIPRLDTLFLASPAESLTQCVGRILRDFPGKQDPVVFDVHDDCVAFRGECANRLRKFTAMGARLIK